MRLFLLVVILTMACCTDATWGKLKAFGNSASVECYSGGKLIFKGKSTGKVRSEDNSDGYYFIDSKDGKVKEVSGECIITYDK